MKKAENNAKEDFEKSQKPKTFTKRSSIGAIIGTTEQKRIFELEKKLKAKESILDVLVRIQSDVSDIKEKLGLYDKFKEETIPKIRHNAIGPFQFLAISLITSEGLLLYWMSEINKALNADPITVPIYLLDTIYYERIIAGSLSLADLIAVLVVFSVVYRIKKKNKDFDN